MEKWTSQPPEGKPYVDCGVWRNGKLICLTENNSQRANLIDAINNILSHAPAQRSELRELFDAMLVAEVKRYGGIPRLSAEEIAFREAMAKFLLEDDSLDERVQALNEEYARDGQAARHIIETHGDGMP